MRETIESTIAATSAHREMTAGLIANSAVCGSVPVAGNGGLCAYARGAEQFLFEEFLRAGRTGQSQPERARSRRHFDGEVQKRAAQTLGRHKTRNRHERIR